MTDNEIIKAWVVVKENKRIPTEYLINETLDLINRQKAEIERLRYNLKAVLDERADHSEAVKEFAERLKGNSNKTEIVWERAIVRTEYTITEEELENLLKEMVGAEE